MPMLLAALPRSPPPGEGNPRLDGSGRTRCSGTRPPPPAEEEEEEGAPEAPPGAIGDVGDSEAGVDEELREGAELRPEPP